MEKYPESELQPENLILFDGICGLCNRSVDWILRRDHAHRFRFAPLQGEWAEAMLSSEAPLPDSIVFIHKGRQHRKSAAVLRILWVLGGFWRLSAICWLLQPLIGDLIYDFIARNRYRWFGRKSECRLPLPEEQAYFLP